jgi:dTDP-4-dehydrorhamnose reductase
MNRILLTGVNGQVGGELLRSLTTLGEVIPASRDGGSGILQMDLSQPDSLRSIIREVRPQLIVNAAAYTAVNQAENNAEIAMAVNGIAPGVMAEEAQRVGAAIVHYSTDYVFDGTKKSPYVEADGTNPLNVYGRTKLVGEQAIQAVDVPQFIFRTSWVYGLRRKNFLLTMLKLAQEKEELKVVDDQVGLPTWSATIAQVTAQILSQADGDIPDFMSSESGVYHLTSTGETSWYGFAKKIFELTDSMENRVLKSVLPIGSEFYPSPVVRPSYSLLDVGALTQTFGLRLPRWDEALEIALGEMRPEC